MIPRDIVLHENSRTVSLHYENGQQYTLPCEFLRVYSPSAEVTGHGQGQEVLQVGKENVNIVQIEPVGRYAVKLVFDDGHNSGLYSWHYLFELATNYEQYWQRYLSRLQQAGYTHQGISND